MFSDDRDVPVEEHPGQYLARYGEEGDASVAGAVVSVSFSFAEGDHDCIPEVPWYLFTLPERSEQRSESFNDSDSVSCVHLCQDSINY